MSQSLVKPSKTYVIDFFKKVLAKAKSTNYFERKIHTTRQSTGNRVTLKTVTGSSSSWKTFTATAPVTGWYFVGCNGGGSSRAAYVSISGVETRNHMSGTGRDFFAGPVWGMKGQTITVGYVYIANVYLYYTPAYEY